jgi:hypothetical protein
MSALPAYDDDALARLRERHVDDNTWQLLRARRWHMPFGVLPATPYPRHE